MHPGALAGIALCAGYGGLELGVAIAEPRYRTVCYVERNAHAAATLVARMGDEALDDAPVWDDLATFDGRPWRGRVHCLTAGYPCQPFSHAGKRRGATDPRHLWPQVARIVAEARPARVFLENVEGHLDLGAADVFGELRAMGYRVKAGLFSALETGAPQNRRRLFIMADADGFALLQPDRDRALERRAALPQRSDADRQPGCARQGGADMDADVFDRARGRRAALRPVPLPLYPPPPHRFDAWSALLDRRPDLQPEIFGMADGLADRME
jgi:DNA (cytosine-5)-methyltransferase 1